MNKLISVTIGDETKELKCDELKLARTLWNKPGTKYTMREMEEFGFELKEKSK